jgi:hypothetical protein
MMQDSFQYSIRADLPPARSILFKPVHSRQNRHPSQAFPRKTTMKAQRFLFSIWLVRPQRRETPAVIGQKFLDTLDALSEADPFFTPWNVLEKSAMAVLPLATARPRIAAIVENNVVRNDGGQPEPQSGYSAIALTDNPITSRIVNVTVNAGAVVPGSHVMLAVGDPSLAPPTRRS